MLQNGLRIKMNITRTVEHSAIIGTHVYNSKASVCLSTLKFRITPNFLPYQSSRKLAGRAGYICKSLSVSQATYTVIRAPWLLKTLEYKYRQSGL